MQYAFQQKQSSAVDPAEQVRNQTKNTSRIRRQHSFGTNLANLDKQSNNNNNKMLLSSPPTYECQQQQQRVPPKVQKRLAVKEKRERAASDQWSPMKVSKHAQNTVNPIRKICDAMAVPPNPNKERICLNLGDPTITGNLLPSEATVQALHDVIDGHKFDGYGPAGRQIYLFVSYLRVIIQQSI